MAVHVANAHQDVGGKAQFGGPFRTQVSEGFAAIVVGGRQVTQHRQENRIQFPEELLRRETAPFLGPHPFGPRHAVAHPHLPEGGDPRQHGRDEIAQLDDRIGIGAQFFGGAQQMQHLGPEIFGRIVPARMAGIIDRRLGAKCLDLSTFLRARMVFP